MKGYYLIDGNYICDPKTLKWSGIRNCPAIRYAYKFTWDRWHREHNADYKKKYRLKQKKILKMALSLAKIYSKEINDFIERERE